MRHNTVVTMKPAFYYGGTLTLFILCGLVASLVKDVGIVFEFVGAISSTSITFVIPAYYYMACESRFMSSQAGSKGMHIACWALAITGVILFFVQIAGTIINIVL